MSLDPGSTMTAKEVNLRLKLFLDLTYGHYIKRRKSSEEYFDLHEAIYFSAHIRKSSFLQTDMERVSNEFLNFLRNNDIPESELHKNRMTNIKAGDLPASCKHLYSVISKTIHEFYIYMDNATLFCPMVDCQEFKRDEQNGLNDFVEYLGKCILEEIYLMIQCKEIENMDYKDVNVAQLGEVLKDITDQLITNGFTIFDAVHHFYKGQLNQYLNNIVQNEDFNDKDLTNKMVGVWISNLVKRRKILGPPLSARLKDLCQKKAYILIRSYSIVEKKVSDKVQFNKAFPDAVEQEAVKIIHDKSKDVKVEFDTEMMQFLNIDEKNWLPPLKHQDERAGNEVFVDVPGNVMILEEIKIEGKGRVQVTACLCGSPR